jgi:N-acetylmuramoyl-L-alanine amidase
MSLKSSRVAGFLSSLLLTTTSVAACFAQPTWNYDRVVSCKDDADNNAIVISTMKGAQLSAPTIQYLPGPNGHAMMVADFAGLSYIMPPHIIHPVQTPGKWGIEEIRVGQFQVNPPVCRVAAISRNPASLKGLSFTSNSGTLIVKWTGARGLIPDPVENAQAPANEEEKSAITAKSSETTASAQTSTNRDSKSKTSTRPLTNRETSPALTAKGNESKATSTQVTKTSASASLQTSSGGEIASTDNQNTDSSSAPLAFRERKPAPSTLPLAYRNHKSTSAKKTSSSGAPFQWPMSNSSDPMSTIDTDRYPSRATTKTTARTASAGLRLQTRDSDDEDIDRGIQHIHDLIDAARRSKIVPGKVQARDQGAPDSKVAGKNSPDTQPQEPAPKQPRTAPQIASASVVPNPAQNNKLLTTPSQDPADTPDTIKKPVPSEPAAAKTKADGEATETGENADLPKKEKSESLRAEKKTEKLPGVPMARLSVVSDTESAEPNAAIQLLSERNITYKSFRLHSPERYIIDLEKPADLDEATVSMFQDNALCRSVRIGMTDKRTCRLVFDLASPIVQVQEKTFEEDGRVLTLKIFNQANSDTPPAMTTKSDLPLEGVSLVLDAGHGGSDPGAQRGDAQEKEMTLGIINQLRKRLEANGAFITMTRSDDTFVSLEDRVKITNLVMPKAFVSVHINALESTNDIKGVETYFQTEQSKPLAEAVHSCLYKSLGVPDRGIRKARFYVINHTSVPAILAEVGYISNKDEREKLISSDYQGKIADALTQGVILYVSKNPETPANAVKTAPEINFNQSAGKGTTAAQTKSVAASLSGSGSTSPRAADEP